MSPWNAGMRAVITSTYMAIVTLICCMVRPRARARALMPSLPRPR